MMLLRRWLARWWPVPRLRTIIIALLVLVAALPGVAAIMLRVYENALVRRTEAELIAQSSALAASATLVLPRRTLPAADNGADPIDPDDRAMTTAIDLRSSAVLPERPAAQTTAIPPDPAAQAMARAMLPVIAATRRETLAAIVLTDRHGVVLTGPEQGRSLAVLPEVQSALAGQAMTVLRRNAAYRQPFLLEWLSRATDLRLHHARPIVIDGQVAGVVLAARSPRALFRGMYEDRGKIATGTMVILLILIGITLVLGRTIVRPIEALSRATRHLAEGRPADLPAPTLRVREIDGLIGDFATMATAIEHRSRYLRDFSAALAHEVKTPLSGLVGGIELLQDHRDTLDRAESDALLANMADDAAALNRLINRLIDLARADLQPAGGDARCDGAALLARLAGDSGVPQVTLAETMPLPALAIAAAALETVLITLIDNARAAGATQVSIHTTIERAMAVIAITDNGSGIAPADRQRIFEPFFTSHRQTGGTGLGLPIARALITGQRGSLTLDSASAATCFVIRVPLAAG